MLEQTKAEILIVREGVQQAATATPEQWQSKVRAPAVELATVTLPAFSRARAKDVVVLIMVMCMGLSLLNVGLSRNIHFSTAFGLLWLSAAPFVLADLSGIPCECDHIYTRT